MKSKSPLRAVLKITLLVTLLVATGLGASQIRAPKQGHARIAVLVAVMVEQYHISHEKIDDEISARFLDRYLKRLDPLKLYFTKGDMEQLERSRKQLDDQIKDGNLEFAFETFNLLLKRLETRSEQIHELIDADYDFTKKESRSIDYKAMAWGTSPELDERWRKRIKGELLLLKLDDVDAAKSREQLHLRYKNFSREMRQVDADEILEYFLTSLTSCFDPHSSYMSPSTWDDFEIDLRLRLDGIGAALRSENGYTIVADIVPGWSSHRRRPAQNRRQDCRR